MIELKTLFMLLVHQRAVHQGLHLGPHQAALAVLPVHHLRLALQVAVAVTMIAPDQRRSKIILNTCVHFKSYSFKSLKDRSADTIEHLLFGHLRTTVKLNFEIK